MFDCVYLSHDIHGMRFLNNKAPLKERIDIQCLYVPLFNSILIHNKKVSDID